MSEPLLCRCDQCGGVTNVVFKEQQHEGGIIETYFDCAMCNERYTSFVTDGQVRDMMARKDRTKKLEGMKERFELQEKINKRMSRLKKELLTSREI